MYLPHNSGVDGGMSHGGVLHASSFFDISSPVAPPGGWSSIIGIVTAIIGNVLISFALNLQRYAHIRLARERDREDEDQTKQDQKENGKSFGAHQSEVAEQRARQNEGTGATAPDGTSLQEPSESTPLIPAVHSRKSSSSGESGSTVRPSRRSTSKPEKTYLQSPYWWAGISLMTLGEAGNFLAYGFAPASIVSPLGVVALVVNCLIAPLMLHERLRIRDGLGVLIAIGGAVTVVLSASDSNPKLAPEKIWELITTWEFETYLGITIFLILVLMAGSNTEFGEKSILVDLGLVGLFGGYTALSTKGVASLLSNTLWHAITFPITYLLVAVLVSTAIMQIKYINRALQRFDSTQVIPTQFVLFTISVILGSAVLYRDFERQTTEDAITFVAGCALTFFGVWLITSGRKNDKEGDDSEEASLNSEGVDLIDETGQQPEIRATDLGRGAHFQSVRSRTPSVVVTHNDYESQSASYGASSPPDHQTGWTGGIPANISAIHIDSADQIPAIASPGRGGQKQAPRMHATTSAPIVPTSSSLHLTTPRPSTPIRQRSTPYPDSPIRIPGSPLARPEIAPRRSIANMFPGPLVTPLSSSLSAIVADSLRKGMDRRPSTLDRRRTSRRTIRPQRSYAGDSHTPRPGTSPGNGYPLRLSVTTTNEDRSSVSRDRPGSASGRGRSFSATVGDLFKNGRGRAGTLESGSSTSESDA